MAESTEFIELNFRVLVDSGIDMTPLTRSRSADLVTGLPFGANFSLAKHFKFQRPGVRISRILDCTPPVGPTTRYCDLPAEESMTVYVLVDLEAAPIMAHMRHTLEEKENLRPLAGTTPQSSNLLDSPTPSSSSSLATNDDKYEDLNKQLRVLRKQMAKKEKKATEDKTKATEERKKLKQKAAKERQKREQKATEERKKLEQKATEEREKLEQKATEEREKLEQKSADQLAQLMEEFADKLEKKFEQKATEEREKSEKKFEQKATEEREKSEKKFEQMADETNELRSQCSHLETQLVLFSNATLDFAASGDRRGLDFIKRRNLLDRSQAILAIYLGLAEKNDFSPSLKFREALSHDTLEARRNKLLVLLQRRKREHEDIAPGGIETIMLNTAALNILADRNSNLRSDGDSFVHKYHERSWYEDAIICAPESEKVSLKSLIDFVFTMPEDQYQEKNNKYIQVY